MNGPQPAGARSRIERRLDRRPAQDVAPLLPQHGGDEARPRRVVDEAFAELAVAEDEPGGIQER